MFAVLRGSDPGGLPADRLSDDHPTIIIVGIADRFVVDGEHWIVALHLDQ